MFIGCVVIYISVIIFKNVKEIRLYNEFLELNIFKRDVIKLILEMIVD